METYSTSVFCVLTQNNRYYNQDLHQVNDPRGLTPHASSRPLRPPTRLWLFTTRKAGVPTVICLSIVHFRGWCIRQVSCYTLLSRFQLPWPRPCCLDAPTPFLGSREQMLRYLRYAFGASRVANSAYQKWPTQGSDSSRSLKKEGHAPRPFRV